MTDRAHGAHGGVEYDVSTSPRPPALFPSLWRVSPGLWRRRDKAPPATDRTLAPDESNVGRTSSGLPSEMAIRLEQVTKSFAGRTVLDNVTIDVRSGTAFCLLGRSGTGKSVTLKHIVGLLKPDAGRVLVHGADVSSLTAQEREMLGLFIDAAKIMDGLFWQQAYGDRDTLLASLKDPAARQFAEFNYGPWDRLDEDRPFVPGVGPKPEGARFYPADMTKQEFEAAKLDGKDSLYTLVERDERGALKVVPYHERWSRELGQAADYVERASRLENDCG